MALRSNIQVSRPTIALLIAAILLPSLIFVALQFGFGYRAERRVYETSTLARADAIMAAIDGNIQRTRASALALATAATIQRRDWRAAYARVRVISSLNPDWKSARLVDVQSSQELFDTRRPFGQPMPVRVDQPVIKRIGTEKIRFEGMIRSGPDCPCLFVEAPVRQDGVIRYLLTIALDPKPIQALLMAEAPAEGTSAVVDQQGYFIARTRDFAKRIGTPATRYVQDAVRWGNNGLYAGVTFEGIANYTAMSRSPLTGWSTHIGVPRATFDSPLWWSKFASGLALLASLILAIGLIWALLNMLSSQRRADERFQQAERLEAVGKMTGGIAHDFNNMLAIVIGSLDLIRRRRSGRAGRYRPLSRQCYGRR